MIFYNPAGAPELACDECGCRWFDRMNNCCYECGAPVSAAAMDEYQRALTAFAGQRESAREIRAEDESPSRVATKDATSDK